jgi:hypothetical protein
MKEKGGLSGQSSGGALTFAAALSVVITMVIPESVIEVGSKPYLSSALTAILVWLLPAKPPWKK